jgi:transposase-like protein
MYAAMNGSTHMLLYAQYGVDEKPKDLMHFCSYLKQGGIELQSATIDGKTSIFRVIKSLWGNCIIQRCTVHIQRQGLSWCRRKPKRTDAKYLRKLFLRVNDIFTVADKESFINGPTVEDLLKLQTEDG